MTPTFYWVFLLGLVGCTASVPRPLIVDACALLCNPGAETESEQERDPILFPRYPKVNCKLQSESDEHQAWVIASHCLKLCATELSISSEVNCFALRSSLQANLGCYCEALSPLSPNTMRLHESWRLNYLVKEVADDIIGVILNSPLDTLILCDLHQELFSNVTLKEGMLVTKCEPKDTETITISTTTEAPERVVRSVDAEEIPEHESPEWLMEQHEEIPEHESAEWLMDHHNEVNTDDLDEMHYMQKLMEELMAEKKTTETTEDVPKAEVIHQMMIDKSLRKKLTDKKPEKEATDIPQLYESISEWKRVCSTICKYESGNKFCQCHNPHLHELSDT